MAALFKKRRKIIISGQTNRILPVDLCLAAIKEKKIQLVAAKRTTGKDWKFLRLNHDSRHWKVDRVLANHSLGSTASQGTSNIPFPWFLLSQCNRQARKKKRKKGNVSLAVKV